MTADNAKPQCEGETNKGERCRMTATTERWYLGTSYQVCAHHVSGLFRPGVVKERAQ